MNRGTYVMFIRLRKEVLLKKPRKMRLEKGLYLYVGSAWNSLTGRLSRHLKKEKKIHWHVDQLTIAGEVVAILALPGLKVEREISEFLSGRFESVRNFGSSDLPVRSNLFRVPEESLGGLLADLISEFLKS